MKKRDRTLRREAERDAEKLADARQKLALLEQGGSPERPIRVDSASQIELRVESMRCARCDGELKVHEHVARVVAGQSLRMVDARCKRCGTRREVWLVIAHDLN
jgi:uncharacterized protein with PIN domain